MNLEPTDLPGFTPRAYSTSDAVGYSDKLVHKRQPKVRAKLAEKPTSANVNRSLVSSVAVGADILPCPVHNQGNYYCQCTCDEAKLQLEKLNGMAQEAAPRKRVNGARTVASSTAPTQLEKAGCAENEKNLKTQEEILKQSRADINARKEELATQAEFEILLAQLKLEFAQKEGRLEPERQVQAVKTETQLQAIRKAIEDMSQLKRAQRDAERKVKLEGLQARRVQLGAERKAKLEEERQARKAQWDAERKAKLEEERQARKAQWDAERKAKLEEERQARQAQRDAERKARQAQIEEERRARQAQLEAEHKAKQAEVAGREASVTIQHIPLGGSAIVTCSTGIDIQHILCVSDCCYVTIKNLPKDVKAVDVEELFVKQGIDRRNFCLLQLRHAAGKVEARVIVEAELGNVVAAGLDGSEFREGNTLSFNVDADGGSGSAPNAMGSSGAKNANVLTLSWHLPSRMLVAAYNCPMDAQSAVASLKDTMFLGRKIRAELDLGRNKTISPENSTSVKISGLPPDADPTEVQTHAGATGIRAIKSPIYDLDSLHQILKGQMQQTSGMESYDVVPIDYAKRGNIEEVHVRFSAWEQAKQLYDSLEGKRVRSDLPTLRARLDKPHQYVISVPSRQYRAQKARWDSIAERDDNKAAFVRVTENNDRVSIRVLGEDRKAVGALKVRVENLVSGQKLNEGLWHRSFTTAPGRQFLDNISSQSTAVVRADWKSQSLKIYSADNAAQETAIQLIKTEIQRLEALEFSAFISRRAIGFFMRKGMPALKEELGEDAVSLDLQPACKLVVRSGGEAARRIVNRLIEESRNDFHHGNKEDETTCPVCLVEPSAPVLMGCGHSYCAPCIRHCLTSAVERKQFPLLCVGNEDKCKVPVAIPIIQRLLSKQQFERLVEAAVMTHIERQPDKFKYCTTPDCSQVYRCDGEKKSFACPSCFASICIACKGVSHEGMACEEWRLLNDVGEQERRNDQWASTAGAKKCSRCQVYIQKIDGCNRVQCLCGAQICWICLAAFNDSGSAYDHLNQMHGGVFAY